MNLSEYLSRPDALSVTELCARIGVKSNAQIRQWQHGYGSRLPSPANCSDLELATGGLIRRWDLRPKDWFRIWPELVGKDGAPQPTTEEAATHG